MKKILIVISALAVLFLAGCSSNRRVYNTGPEQKAGEPMIIPTDSFPQDAGVWIVEKGLKGEAGVYAEKEIIPISSLKINMTIFDLLSKVYVSLKFQPPQEKKDLQFRYPQVHGMLVESFTVFVDGRRFRAVIAKKESAEELYQLARNEGLSAVKVSQKTFSEMIVSLSLKSQQKISVNFDYTQLSSVSGDSRIIALPEFKGIENADSELRVLGRFASEFENLTGLNRKVPEKNFNVVLKDKELLKKGIQISYKTKVPVALVSPGGDVFYWNRDQKTYDVSRELNGVQKIKVEEKLINKAISYVKYRNAMLKGTPYKEAQNMAIQAKLLTPITKLILVDAVK